jgi:hypothetical protein
MLVFLVANAVTWSVFVLIVRILTNQAPSFYILADESVFIFSGLQGLIVACWLEVSRRGEDRV